MNVVLLIYSILLLPSLFAFFTLCTRCKWQIVATLSILVSIALFAVLLYTKYTLGTEMSVMSFLRVSDSIKISFVFERLGIFFALISSFLWIIANIYSVHYLRINKIGRLSQFMSYLALSMSCVMGVAFAGNLITLFVFYELLTLTTYPLVIFNRSRESLISGRVYIIMLISSSLLFFLLAILLTYNIAGTTDFTEGGILYGLSYAELNLLLLLFVYGVGKSAVMPMHGWLPRAMVAPSPVSAFLHAVAVVKVGVFAVIKIIVYIFGLSNLHESVSEGYNILLYVAGISTVLSTLIALQQDNIKKMLAYSTISQLSYIIMSTALFEMSAIKASFFYLLVHAFAKITLFFVAGIIYSLSGIKNISELGGIAKKLPLTMIAFTISALAMIGLPPTAGIISKFMVINTAGADYLFIICVTVISTMINAGYFLPALRHAFFGVCVEATEVKIKKETLLFVLPALITSAGVVIIFFIPNAILQIT